MAPSTCFSAEVIGLLVVGCWLFSAKVGQKYSKHSEFIRRGYGTMNKFLAYYDAFAVNWVSPALSDKGVRESPRITVMSFGPKLVI